MLHYLPLMVDVMLPQVTFTPGEKGWSWDTATRGHGGLETFEKAVEHFLVVHKFVITNE